MSLLSPKDVNSIIISAHGSSATIVNYHLEKFSEINVGLLGTHRLLVVELEDESNERKIETFFVKSRPESIAIEENIMDNESFLEELHFFTKVYPLLMEVYQGERWSPRCLLANENVLVMEDLRAQGFAPCIADDVLNEQALKSTLSTLARFHAASVLAETHLNKSLKEAFPDAFKEKLYSYKTKMGSIARCSYKTIGLIADKLGLNSSLVPKIYERLYKLVRPQKGKFNVLCHSDLWKYNVLFDSCASPAKCILVDFQALRYGSPLIDFSMLLYLNTTMDYRKKKILELLKHYYSAFRDELLRSNIKAEVPSYDIFLNDFYEYRITGMVIAASYLPGMWLKSFQSILNDPELLMRYFSGSRMEWIAPIMDEDPVYREQVRGIIEELLEEAARVIG